MHRLTTKAPKNHLFVPKRATLRTSSHLFRRKEKRRKNVKLHKLTGIRSRVATKRNALDEEGQVSHVLLPNCRHKRDCRTIPVGMHPHLQPFFLRTSTWSSMKINTPLPLSLHRLHWCPPRPPRALPLTITGSHSLLPAQTPTGSFTRN